jgi:hypothetical protein
LEVCNAPAAARERHLQSPRGFGETLRFHDRGEDHQSVQVAHHPVSWKVNFTTTG